MSKELADVLGDEPPVAIAALPEADRHALVAVIEAARERQAADLAESFTRTLRHIPFPLRGVVKKVLIG